MYDPRKRFKMPDSIIALAAFAKTFGIAVISVTTDIPATTTDGVVVFIFIPVSASPAEQGRILAEFMRGMVPERRVA